MRSSATWSSTIMCRSTEFIASGWAMPHARKPQIEHQRHGGPRNADAQQSCGFEHAKWRFTNRRDAAVEPAALPPECCVAAPKLKKPHKSSHTTREPRQIGPSPEGPFFCSQQRYRSQCLLKT